VTIRYILDFSVFDNVDFYVILGGKLLFWEEYFCEMLATIWIVWCLMEGLRVMWIITSKSTPIHRIRHRGTNVYRDSLDKVGDLVPSRSAVNLEKIHRDR
jgi:hypothetical protein